MSFEALSTSNYAAYLQQLEPVKVDLPPPPYGAENVRIYPPVPQPAPQEEQPAVYNTTSKTIEPNITAGVLISKIEAVRDAAATLVPKASEATRGTTFTARSSGRTTFVSPLIIDNSARAFDFSNRSTNISIGNSTHIHNNTNSGRRSDRKEEESHAAAGIAGAVMLIAAVAFLGSKMKGFETTSEHVLAAQELKNKVIELRGNNHPYEQTIQAEEIASGAEKLFEAKQRNKQWTVAVLVTIAAAGALALIGALTSAPVMITVSVAVGVAGVATAGYRLFYTWDDDERFATLAKTLVAKCDKELTRLGQLVNTSN